MYTIAFFWVGDNTSIPQYLVNSIRLLMGKPVEVIQLTDEKTPAVSAVTKIQRLDLSADIMVARLQAYAHAKASGEFTFFCDADSLFINPLDLNFIAGNVLVTTRVNNHPINDQYPEFYPEFTGKMIKDVMPFLFGAIAVKGVQNEFFDSLLNMCLNLPERFHRWYGDQYSLAQAITLDEFQFGYLDPQRHLCIVSSEVSSAELFFLRTSNVQMLTFKGKQSKIYIDGTLKNLQNLLLQSAFK